MRGSRTAVWAAIIGSALFGVAWGSAIVPRVFPGIGQAGVLVVAFVGLVCAVASAVFFSRSGSSAPVQRLGIARELAVFFAPVLSTTLLVVAWVGSGGYPAWAMRGDMVWNTAQTLFIHADGGVAPEIHPNPAPLTNVLFAIAYGPTAQPSLAAVFGAHAVVILCVAMLASVVSGRYVAERARHLHPVISWGAVCAVGFLPYAGVILGSAALIGHANMLTSYLVLWLAWVAYSEVRWHPALRVALLLVFSTVTVASWAPLVTVPISLTLAATIEWWRARRGSPGATRLQWVAVVAGLAQLMIYALLVTLPDLRREGSALSQNGAAFTISMRLTAVTFVAIAVAAALTWVAATKRLDSVRDRASLPLVGSMETVRYESVLAVGRGMLAMMFVSVPGLGYLMLQRVGMDSLWGYYPVKYVLLLTTVAVGVLLGSVVAVLSDSSGALRDALVLGLAAILVLLPVLAPFGGRPSATSLAPAVRFVTQPLSATQIHAIDTLVDIADSHRGEANLFIDDDVWSEAFVNSYLIQLSAQRSTDEFRVFAYASDHLSQDQLCSLIEIWNRPVNVFVGEDHTGRAKSLEACGVSSLTFAPAASVR